MCSFTQVRIEDTLRGVKKSSIRQRTRQIKNLNVYCSLILLFFSELQFFYISFENKGLEYYQKTMI